MSLSPKKIFEEYRNGIKFKSSIGSKGLYEQNKINERFFAGDQWYGARCGNDRPLVRHNIIKRIGDYKISMIGSNTIGVNYSAEGVPNTFDCSDIIGKVKNGENYITQDYPDSSEISLVTSALSDYYKVTAERVGFENIRLKALKNAYISGDGIVYTYWNPDIRTGLYADSERKCPIRGDIECEVLDIENVYFGDPSVDDIQRQPYIIIAQRKSVSQLQMEAKRNSIPKSLIEQIKPDDDLNYLAGNYSDSEQDGLKKATVLTKFYKEYDENGDYKIMAVRVSERCVIKEPWDTGLQLYPLAKFSWESSKNCIYSQSEVTNLIPNQIAINRMVTAGVWSVMMMGMPIMVVNGTVVSEPVTNDPGQIIKVFGKSEDTDRAIRYVQPPTFSTNLNASTLSLIEQTLTQNGANDAALGDVAPNNTSAIIAVREAAALPLQTVKNRYYQFCEDIARIWAEYWIKCYGKRSIKIEDDSGTWYMPFDGSRYKDFTISVRIDVGASSIWSEAQAVQTLDNLFDKGIINVVEYLQRMPKGIIPDVGGLIKDITMANSANAVQSEEAQAHLPIQSVDKAEEIPTGISDIELYNSLTDEDKKKYFFDIFMGGDER